MGNYNKKALADSQSNILWSQYGEVLRLVDSTNINMKILTNVLKRPIIKPRFRLFVLNPDETINYEIPEEDIIKNSGNFTENYQNGQRKNVNLNLINIDGKYTPNINTIWVHTRFRLDVGVEFNNQVYWFPRGVYILGNPSASHNNSDKQITLTLVDKFAVLEGKQGTLESTYEIPVGSDIEQAIIGILTLDNGSGYPIDLKPIIYDRSFKGLKMPYTLSKDAGSTLGEMILEIGTILNAEVYYNSQGNLCFININETTLDIQKASLWDYTEIERSYFSGNASYDFENVINEVHIVGDNIDNDVYSAMAVNDNPSSPLCIQRIGRRIEYINDSNIYSDDLAQQRAAYELRKYSILKTTMNITVSFNPLLFVNNLVTISDSLYHLDRERFLIQSISYSLGDNCSMTISCSNVSNFSVIENPIVISVPSDLYPRDDLYPSSTLFPY